jgi:hypothetical protein
MIFNQNQMRHLLLTERVVKGYENQKVSGYSAEPFINKKIGKTWFRNENGDFLV